MNKRTTLILLILVLALGLTYFTLNKKDMKEEESLNGDLVELNDPEILEENQGLEDSQAEEELMEAIDFKLTNLDGEEVTMDDYKGKVVFLNFWATWCQYCDMEMPDLEKLQNENEDLVVVSVNAGESEKVVRKYVEEKDISFEVLLNPENDLAAKYYVTGLPATFFIDKEGYVRGVFPAMMTYDQMLEALDILRI